MTKPEQRSPGRPRSNRIEFFAVESFMRQNNKFIKLQRILNISEEKAWNIVTSMFCYVAQRHALEPIIEDVEMFAKFCYWDGKPDILIQALISANFCAETNGKFEVVNWFQNQTYASKKVHGIESYQKQKDNQFPSISDQKLDVRAEQSREVKEKRSVEKGNSNATHPPASFNSAPLPSLNVKEKLMNLAIAMSQTFGINGDSDEMNTIYQKLAQITNTTSIENAEKIAEQIQSGYTTGRIKKPIGILIKEAQKYQ